MSDPRSGLAHGDLRARINSKWAPSRKREIPPVFTNHLAVLVVIARSPRASHVEIAWLCGLNDRSVARILDGLVDAGYVGRTREGRRNRYSIHAASRLSLQGFGGTVGDLLALVAPDPATPVRTPTTDMNVR